MEDRILELQKDIRHLARMVDVEVAEPMKQLGLTDAIRYVIRNHGKPIAPTEVRDELLKRYCSPNDYRNLLASVHTVMKRLAGAGAIRFDGTKAQWTGELPPTWVIGFVPGGRNGRRK